MTTVQIEDTDVTLARAAGWTWPDIWWERWQARAKRYQLSGNLERASELWLRCYCLAWLFLPSNDPRWAVSLVNAGTVYECRGQQKRAQRFMTRGVGLLRRVPAWMEGMKFATRARSSGFHLRLGQEHAATYRQNERERYLQHLHQLTASIEQRHLEPSGEECRWVIERPPVYDDTRRLAGALFLCAYAVPRRGTSTQDVGKIGAAQV